MIQEGLLHIHFNLEFIHIAVVDMSMYHVKTGWTVFWLDSLLDGTVYLVGQFTWWENLLMGQFTGVRV